MKGDDQYNKYLNYIGIFQICDESNNPTSYGIGIIQQDQLTNSIITLQEYFQDSSTVGKIYFKKRGQHQIKDFLFNIKAKPQDYFSFQLQNGSKTQIVNSLIKISFSQRPSCPFEIPKPLPKKQMITYETKCQQIGVQAFDIKQGNILLEVKKINYKDRDQSLSVSVLLAEINDKIWFYGFSRKQQQWQFSYQNYYFLEEIMNIPNYNLGNQNGNQLYIGNQPQVPIPDTTNLFPLHSIGMIKFKGIHGTAFFLQDEDNKTSQYLLTAAHNFTKNLDLNDFQLYLQQQNSKKQIHRKIDGDPFIMDKYKNANAKKVDVTFNMPVYNIKIKEKRLYDIAIIKLSARIDLSNCLTIRKKKSFTGIIQQKVEIAGYPRQETNVGTQKGLLYLSPQSKYNSILLSTQQNLIKHNLSTLAGNSGSPIYEKQQKNVYLFGVHTYGQPTPLQKLKKRKQRIHGLYNLGTYIYSKQVWQFMQSIPNFLSSLKYSSE